MKKEGFRTLALGKLKNLEGVPNRRLNPKSNQSVLELDTVCKRSKAQSTCSALEVDLRFGSQVAQYLARDHCH